jgi:hypothetical protein
MMEQRSPNWFDERARRITASRFADVLADVRSDRYRQTMRRLVNGIRGDSGWEREAEEAGEVPAHFAHGREWEAAARGLYEWEREVTVVVPGLIVHPTLPYVACSPDGLVGDDGGIEIKSHKSLDLFLESKRYGVPSHYVPQVQGSLWVTGRAWWDFVSYYQHEVDGKLTQLFAVTRVEPDPFWFAKLERACVKFWAKANQLAG